MGMWNVVKRWNVIPRVRHTGQTGDTIAGQTGDTIAGQTGDPIAGETGECCRPNW